MKLSKWRERADRLLGAYGAYEVPLTTQRAHAFLDARALIPRGAPQSAVIEGILQAHLALRWASLSFPTFAPSAALTAKLLLTDTRGAVSAEDLRWPYPTFAIAMPALSVPLLEYDAGGTVTAVNTVFVHRFDAVGSGAADDFRWASFPEPDLYERELTRRGRVEGLHVLCTDSSNEGGIDVHTTMAADHAATWCVDDIDADDRLTDPTLTLAELDRRCLAGAVRLAVNLALYLAHRPSEGTRRPSRKRAKAREVDGLWFDVGRETVIDKTLYRAAAVRHPEGEPAWRLARRHVVRGHWRNQAHGPQHTLRRRQWIEPFVRGPELGQQLDRIYTVKEGDPCR